MSAPTSVCPGCQKQFQPGGYANHLRLSHDIRCRSIRSSQLRTAFNRFHPPSPAPASRSPPVALEPPTLDIEMIDISDELDQLSGRGLNPPPPNRTTLANQLNGWEGTQSRPELDADELPAMGPHRPSLGTIIISPESDVDSDESDDDDNHDRLSRRNLQASSPGLVDSENSEQATAVETASMFI